MREIILCICLFLANPVVLAVDSQDQASKTQVVLLGTGNPNPFPDRAGPAIAIIVNDTPYLFDAGAGLIRRAEEARVKYGLKGLGRTKFSHLFLTHLHWDHTIDVPEVLLSPWTQGRETALQVYGPLGTKALANNIAKAYAEDIKIRLNGLEPATKNGWKLKVTEFDRTYTYKDDNITVEAFPVCHGDIEQAVGYKVTTPDKVIVISGDTAYCPILAEKAKGADILLHEGYPTASHAKLPDDWAAYHTAFHTSAVDIARIANVARPKLLVLYHQLTWGGDPLSMIAEEIAKTYDGVVINGKDLDIF